MKITFLGTRGYIDVYTRRHRRHSATLISYRNSKVLVDCGLDWLGKVKKIDPDAIIITHAHPDHVGGLKNGAPCPVYATSESWDIINKYPINDRRIVKIRKRIKIGTVFFEAFPVVHSVIAPAVGYRISAGKSKIFYVTDLVYIEERHAALSKIQLYVGDGSTIKRPIIRRSDDTLIGHAAIQTQLTWCKKEGIHRAIFTHCGSEIVEGDGRTIGAKIRALGKVRGVKASVAYDGLEIVI